ncbi:N-acetylglucosamine-6-phosphate deacetylase [Oceanobacillus jeddahense]|uniref:N-acetylglucosamine-6-phosphate deacetylase n=1 Tax=Oceanobacillus jeddahense TaxID=1462527 RepID=A0ABY5JQD9_9BACI|nr:N-acetylglucosamine-6-phosphate deacetylase [Oceanobacillus jeddahense]UUI02537.1 N-acetylglucosamine-6-phosphate deacetylase [Oceanobacillus jeddahense]
MGQEVLLIKNIQEAYLPEEVLKNVSILVEDGKIANILTQEETADLSFAGEVIDAKNNLKLLPGFIDAHIHGGYGVDIMDATPETLQTLAENLPSEGTTSYLATTITQSDEEISNALKNIAAWTTDGQKHGADLAGVHLEGPFVEVSKAGAQPKQYITEPDLAKFLTWQDDANGQIRTITMAPEHDKTGEFIKTLAQSGVNISAGHTDASFQQIKDATKLGVRQLTHLCNAMNGIHHRDIGAVGASFQLKDLRAELISDGIHVVPEMLQLIFDNVGSERIIMITDAMRAKGLEDGEYELGGQPVIVKNRQANLKSGSLAGSVLTMIDAVKNMLQLDGVTIQDIVKMTAVNPAQQVGILDRKGSIEVGKDADFVLLNDGADIAYTICRGEVVYQEGK